jgi:hypothetical protein
MSESQTEQDMPSSLDGSNLGAEIPEADECVDSWHLSVVFSY